MSTRRPRTSRKTRWTRERSRSRARVRDTCTSLRRLCGVVSHASRFFDIRRREEVTFSGCGPLALSLSLCLSLQRKTHSNRKNGAKSLAQLVQILLLCRLPDVDERAPCSLFPHVLRTVSRRKGCRRAASLAESLAAVGPKDRGQGIVTARDRVVRRAMGKDRVLERGRWPWSCMSKWFSKVQRRLQNASSLQHRDAKSSARGSDSSDAQRLQLKWTPSASKASVRKPASRRSISGPPYSHGCLHIRRTSLTSMGELPLGA